MHPTPNSRLALRWLFTASLFIAAHVFAAEALHQTKSAPSLDPVAQLVKTCTGCHGPEGRATPYGYFPRIAGKPENYLYNQLLNFQEGRRVYPQMSYLLENLDPSYLKLLAHYFATQELDYPAPAQISSTDVQLELGRRIVREGVTARDIPACTACHGDALTGVAPSIPGILGLPRDYMISQLGAWRTNQRHAQSPDCMAQVANNLSVSEISAVTAWLSSAPWPKGGRPLQTMTKPLPISCGTIQKSQSQTQTVLKPSGTKTTLTAQEQKGEYLTRIGNCQACHTRPGADLMTGNRPIETPFGVVYSSNLTPDPDTGMGKWTADDFWRALHTGQSKDGHLLTPAFPYSELTQITRLDADSMFAYLRTLPPKHLQQTPNTLAWPYNTQLGLVIWRSLYFKVGEFTEDPQQSKLWNRGSYLVNGLSHCGSCHTPRNFLGGSQSQLAFKGAYLTPSHSGNWFAPSLMDPSDGGVQNWSEEEVQTFLLNGITPKGYVNGPMAEVVFKGTQYLSAQDAQSVAVYLKSLKSKGDLITDPVAPKRAVASGELKSGARLYDKHCESCHGKQGEGLRGKYPALANNRNVVALHINNAVQAVLLGGIPPTTTGHPMPFGMPPYRAVLSDTEVADVLSYIRNSWGNQASAVSTFEVMQATGHGK